MILKDFIKNLNEFVEENPETLDMQVITSIDSEGNGFEYVHYTPSKGLFENHEFIQKDEENDLNCNAVCIN